ncbi:hypothetical protein IE53DRAFT_366424 [Violaceomyces palustris]|uniref:Uncharacterized protein n=1 Tax=Violaceomyces palustris TaxID=1673888 RepID=A0ACD0P5K7_9BASI|nr:hypothetical protein IE53DRAFT_366424 [Violaceomyces palustris]
MSMRPAGLLQQPLYEEDESENDGFADQAAKAKNGLATQQHDPSTSTTTSAHQASPLHAPTKVPAAGLGTRTGPRPAPKSSSSLRHVSANPRTTSFEAALPEDRDPSQPFLHSVDPSASIVAKQVVAEKKKTGFSTEEDNFFEESDLEDDSFRPSAAGEETDYFSSSRPRASSHLKGKSRESESNAFGGFTSGSSDGEDWGIDDDPNDETNDDFQRKIADRTSAHAYGIADDKSQRSRKRASTIRWSKEMASLDALGTAQTPGPSFPDLTTPNESSPYEAPPDINPRQRLEWQTMLASVLNSEVLKSETKRINSVDTPDLTKAQLAHRRWLDIRATLRGRGLREGVVEAEARRVAESWAVMLRDVISEIKKCRQEHIEQDTGRPAHYFGGWSRSRSESTESSEQDIEMSEDEIAAEREKALKEVGTLLAKVDCAEEQFPTTKKAIEVVPEWGSREVQDKLEALYSWYNVTTSLRLQISILQKWTGSETLDITTKRNTMAGNGGQQVHEHSSDMGQHHEAPHPALNSEADDTTFVERILKEGSLKSTFEKRTLSALDQLITKSKETILSHHESFRKMALPSFEPELVQLINFPTRLMQGALMLRLDYAGKIADPSLLIVDSLIDDLRSALALACRIKLQYIALIVPEPERGWDLAPCIADGYDEVLRKALKFFFKLLNFKLKGGVFFKETEILEPEWRFLSTAVEVIDGADIIVARSITKIVNRLFQRIIIYFNQELVASFAEGEVSVKQPGKKSANPVVIPSDGAARGPATAGALTKGKVLLTLEERAKWIHAVFENVRIRSRKLLGFARDIRSRLDNAAEYDLGSLRSSIDVHDNETAKDEPKGRSSGLMDLGEFMQTLINAGYFLVYTESFEEEGVYVIAEPSLHDKPDVIQELLCKCLHRVRPSDEETAMAAEANANALNADGDGAIGHGEDEPGHSGALREDPENLFRSLHADGDDEHPRYLLLLSPRDPFMWTGRVMKYSMPRIDVTLKDRRVRLVADGPKGRLELCKQHFYSVFANANLYGHHDDASDYGHGAFPLETINEHMAHMSYVQSGLEDINKGVYKLSHTLIKAAPKIRRQRKQRNLIKSRSLPKGISSDFNSSSDGGWDELIQNCYGMVAEQGRRSLPFIESTTLQNHMTLALGKLAIDWVAFICDDCVPSDRKTFKWAVTALSNANFITNAENIFQLSESDFDLLRSKVASCMALLISHFDILGARSSVAKAQEEQERLEREKAERNRASDGHNFGDAHSKGEGAENESSAESGEVYEGASGNLSPALGAQLRLNRLDSAMQATEQRWIQKVMEWDAARQSIEGEQRLIGRVLDDTRLEDRSLQFLAQAGSKVTIRWQQGRFIGGGTFGTVYLAVNLDTGGLMAVKEIRFHDISSNPNLYKQIKDEMHVMSMLSHPNIVEYYGIEVHRDKVFIFEEYCQGGSLSQLLEYGRIEDEAVTQVYTLQMLEGLIYLHSEGVVHRDIKPDNILLDHMGVIKFVDFGAAKVLAKNSRTVQRSRRPGAVGGGAGGMLMGGPDGKPGMGAAGAGASLQGTPMYMSPEVIKGENRGRRGAMDVWSLGCVVLEFATGRRPWSQLDNEWAIMFHIGMAQHHPALPEPGQLSESGIDFIRQCLIIDPYERPSAAEMKEHPWIKSLTDELEAANMEEGFDQETFDPQNPQIEFASQLMSPQVRPMDGAIGIAAAAATPGTRSINGFNFPRPQVSSIPSSSDGSRSRLSNGGSSQTASISIQQQQQWIQRQQQRQQEQPRQMAGVPSAIGGNLERHHQINHQYGEEYHHDQIQQPLTASETAERHHWPGHPNHSHPGYEALYADRQYRQEEEQTRAMLQSDSLLSPRDSDIEGEDGDQAEKDGSTHFTPIEI